MNTRISKLLFSLFYTVHGKSLISCKPGNKRCLSGRPESNKYLSTAHARSDDEHAQVRVSLASKTSACKLVKIRSWMQDGLMSDEHK